MIKLSYQMLLATTHPTIECKTASRMFPMYIMCRRNREFNTLIEFSTSTQKKFHTKKYTNFDFCEGKNHKHLESRLIYKAKQLMLKTNQENIHILEDAASSVQVDILNT